MKLSTVDLELPDSIERRLSRFVANTVGTMLPMFGLKSVSFDEVGGASPWKGMRVRFERMDASPDEFAGVAEAVAEPLCRLIATFGLGGVAVDVLPDEVETLRTNYRTLTSPPGQPAVTAPETTSAAIEAASADSATGDGTAADDSSNSTFKVDVEV